MKKLLLGLGTLSLAILPVVAVVSCSSPTPTPTLESEISKYNISVKTKDSTAIANDIVEKIIKTKEPARTAILKTIANVPEVSKGFTMEVISASLDPNTPTSIKVGLKIKENTTPKEGEAIFTVEGLTAGKPTLETEAAKFQPKTTKTPEIEVASAINTINIPTQQAQKLAALNALVEVPKLSQGFDIEVKSATEATIKTSIDVNITLIEKTTRATMNIVFTITGLKETVPTLDSEATKFNVSVPTTDEFLATSQALVKVNIWQDQKDKYESIVTFAPIPAKISKFNYLIGTVITDASDKKIVKVPITISDPSLTNNNTRDVTFTITNLWEHSAEEQENKFAAPVGTISTTATISEAVDSINGAISPEAKLVALKLLAPIPKLDLGFTFEIRSAIANAQTATTMVVIINIIQHSNVSENTSISETALQVTGFKAAAESEKLLAEVKKYNITTETTKPNMLLNEASNSIYAASTQADKLAALKVFANVPELSPGFTMEIKAVTLSFVEELPLLQVTMWIREEATTKRKLTHFTVSGLTATAIEREANKFKDPVPTLNTTSMTSSAAVALIMEATTQPTKLAALKLLAKVPALDQGFDMQITSANVSQSANTSIEVKINIISLDPEENGNTLEVTFIITGFQPPAIH